MLSPASRTATLTSRNCASEREREGKSKRHRRTVFPGARPCRACGMVPRSFGRRGRSFGLRYAALAAGGRADGVCALPGVNHLFRGCGESLDDQLSRRQSRSDGCATSLRGNQRRDRSAGVPQRPLCAFIRSRGQPDRTLGACRARCHAVNCSVKRAENSLEIASAGALKDRYAGR